MLQGTATGPLGIMGPLVPLGGASSPLQPPPLSTPLNLAYPGGPKSDYVNIMPHKLQNTRYLYRLNTLNICYLLFTV